MEKEVIVALIGLVGVLIPSMFTFLKDKEKPQKEEYELPKCTQHSMFSRLKDFSTYLKTTYHLPNKGRSLLTRDHMLYKFKTGYDILYKLAEETDECYKTCTIGRVGCPKLYTRNLGALDDIVIAYNNFINSEDFTDAEREIIKIYTPIFNMWHHPRVEKVQDVNEYACSSDYYRGAGCIVRQSIVFDNYASEYGGTIKDAADTMNDINGDLTGKVYKGEVM